MNWFGVGLTILGLWTIMGFCYWVLRSFWNFVAEDIKNGYAALRELMGNAHHQVKEVGQRPG